MQFLNISNKAINNYLFLYFTGLFESIKLELLLFTDWTTTEFLTKQILPQSKLLVSMDSKTHAKFLKYHFGTLFLTNYALPHASEARDIIDEFSNHGCSQQEIVDKLCDLLDLLSGILLHKNIIESFSTKNFLGQFSDRLIKDVDNVYPTDLVNAGLMFFKSFLMGETPRENFKDRMIEWCQMVVQFNETSPKRMELAFKFIGKVRNYIQMKTLKMKSCLKSSMSSSHFDEIDSCAANKKDLDHEFYLGENTQSCDCFEYEISGDCYCDLSV